MGQCTCSNTSCTSSRVRHSNTQTACRELTPFEVLHTFKRRERHKPTSDKRKLEQKQRQTGGPKQQDTQKKEPGSGTQKRHTETTGRTRQPAEANTIQHQSWCRLAHKLTTSITVRYGRNWQRCMSAHQKYKSLVPQAVGKGSSISIQQGDGCMQSKASPPSAAPTSPGE